MFPDIQFLATLLSDSYIWCITSTETLATDEALYSKIYAQTLGPDYCDEAHHIPKDEKLFDRIKQLSRKPRKLNSNCHTYSTTDKSFLSSIQIMGSD